MKCSWCQAEISDKALICTECSHYVHDWKNQLKYWSSIIGLVAFFASALTVVVRFGDEAYSELFRPDLSVSDFVTFSPSAIWNLSKSDAWITTIDIKSPAGGYDLQWNILKLVKPKAAYRFNLTKLTDDNWSGYNRNLFDKKMAGNFAINLAPTQLEAIEKSYDGGRFVLDFMWSNGPQYKQLKRHFGDELPEFTCSISVHYQLSIDGVNRIYDVPCVALARRRRP